MNVCTQPRGAFKIQYVEFSDPRALERNYPNRHNIYPGNTITTTSPSLHIQCIHVTQYLKLHVSPQLKQHITKHGAKLGQQHLTKHVTR